MELDGDMVVMQEQYRCINIYSFMSEGRSCILCRQERGASMVHLRKIWLLIDASVSDIQ